MATIVDLTTRGPLTFTSHGLADYLLSTPSAQRRTLLEHLFPDDAKPKILQRQPARDLAHRFFIGDCDPEIIHEAIRAARRVPSTETTHARGRREAVLDVASALPTIAAATPVQDLKRFRVKIPVSGLVLSASVDLLGVDVRRGKHIALIFNSARVTASTAERLKHFAKIQCEVVLRAASRARVDCDEVWYIDLCTGSRVKRQASVVDTTWHNIEIACDRIAIEMRELIRRRQRLALARNEDP